MIVIKSYKGGIALHLNEDEDFESLLDQVAEKFEESRKFFRDASLALSVEGRYLLAEEEKRLIQTIENNSDIKIICLVGKNEATNKKFIKALKRVEMQREEYNGRFYVGNVADGDVIESEGNLVVTGNVYPGGTVAAAKNIMVMGELLGDAYAGLDENPGHYITAIKLSPHLCKIGSLSFNGGIKGLFDKRRNAPAIIYEKNGELISDTLSPEIIDYVTTV